MLRSWSLLGRLRAFLITLAPASTLGSKLIQVPYSVVKGFKRSKSGKSSSGSSPKARRLRLRRTEPDQD